jgi:alkanesulfonate monooxygenase SsuD/methylene tetrahydromethanopterin reductase-like flavin-dependent oxidoreductase (luciferase family)
MRTNCIRIATGVLNIWGRSAASIAMLAASLSSLSDGRFTLGLGVGSPQLAEGLHGLPFRDPVHRLDVVTRDVRALLRGERLVSSPPTGRTPIRLGVRPQFDVPVHLAALGEKSVRLCGELADAWFPFLLPISALHGRIQLLTVGTADREDHHEPPLICPGVPAAISSDPAAARRLASWWITFYLTKMGTLYSSLLRDVGHNMAVAAVHAETPKNGADELTGSAQVLIDELTLCGSAESARADLERWYRAGADMPVIILPPHRDIDELDHILDAMRPQ